MVQEPLRGPLQVVVPTTLSLGEATAVLRRTVEEESSVEMAANAMVLMSSSSRARAPRSVVGAGTVSVHLVFGLY